MKKVNIILFIFLIIVVVSSTVYFTHFYGNENIDYTKYKHVYQQLSTCEKFEQHTDIDIKAKKAQITDNKYRVVVTFDNAKFLMQKVNILIIDEYKNKDFIYPSLGLLKNVELDLIVDDNANNNQKKGVFLDYISNNDVDKLLIYFSYVVNEERIEKFYEVKVDVAS